MAITPTGGDNELEVVINGDGRGLANAIATSRKKIGGLMKSVGALSAALGGLASAGFAKSIGAAADFDAAMTESLAIIGDVSDAMREDMEQAARDVAKTTTHSANEAADSYFYLASAGLDAAESMEAMPQVAEFAQAGMFEMERATDILTDATSALGMEMSEMGDLSDMMVKANQQANTSVEQVGEALTNKLAPAMRSAGVATEEGIGALSVFADQGLKGRRAGTILARTIEGLSSQARENSEAFEELGIQVFDADGEMRSMQAITTEMEDALGGMSTEQRDAALAQLGFNQRAQQGINLLLGQSDSLAEYTDGVENAGGATEEVANKQLESFNAQLDLLKSRIYDVGLTIGQALLGPLTTLVGHAGTALESVESFIDGLEDAEIQAAAVASGFMTIGGAIAYVNPLLGGLVLALGAVASAAVANWETVESTVATARQNIGRQLDIIEASYDEFAEAVGEAFSPITDAWDSLTERADEATGDISSMLHNRLVLGIEDTGRAIGSGLDAATAFFEEHGDDISTAIGDGYETASRTVEDSLEWVEDRVDEHGPTVQSHVEDAYEGAREHAATALDTLQTRVVGPGLDAVSELWDDHGSDIQETVRDLATRIREDPAQAIEDFANEVPPLIAPVATAVGSAATDIRDDAVPKYRTAFDDIGGALESALEGDIDTALSNLESAFVNTLEGTRNALVGADGTSGIVGTFVTDMATFLREDAPEVLGPAWREGTDVLETGLEETRTVLVGEAGDGGIVGLIVRQAGETLRNAPSAGLESAAEEAWSVIATAGEQAKITVIGEEGSGGLIGLLISELSSFLESQAAEDLATASASMVATGITAPFKEAMRLLFWDDKSVIKGVIMAIGTWLEEDGATDIKNSVMALGGLMVTWWKTLADDIYTEFRDELIRLLVGDSAFPEVFDAIEEYLRNDAYDDLKGGLGSVYDDITGKLDDLPGEAVSIGKDMVSSIGDGVRDKVGEVTGAASDVADEFAAHWPRSPAEKGPLQELPEMARNVPETIATEMEGRTRPVVDASETVASAAMPAMGPQPPGRRRATRQERAVEHQSGPDGQERLLRRIAEGVEKGNGGIVLQIGRREFGKVVEDVQDDRAGLEVTR